MNYITIYANFLKKFINPRRKLKVIFDCSNGTAGSIVRQLKIKNLKLKIINGRPDGNFPAHGPNPLKTGATEQLQKEVKKNKSDLGIIFDADGDRAFFIDNRGRFVDPDIIARLLIWHLKPKKVVIDVRTGWLVRRGIMNNELGIKNKNKKTIIHNSRFILLESKVGHYFIKKLMKQKKADFGAERSGHYYFASQILGNGWPLGSGILAAIEIINAVSELPYNLADFVDLLPQYYRFQRTYTDQTQTYTENNTERSIRIKKLLKKIEMELKAKSYPPATLSRSDGGRGKLKARVSRLDGLTMEFKDGFASRSFGEGWWFNIRLSNTEPLMRLSAEANNRKVLQRVVKKLTALIKKM